MNNGRYTLKRRCPTVAKLALYHLVICYGSLLKMAQSNQLIYPLIAWWIFHSYVSLPEGMVYRWWWWWWWWYWWWNTTAMQFPRCHNHTSHISNLLTFREVMVVSRGSIGMQSRLRMPRKWEGQAANHFPYDWSEAAGYGLMLVDHHLVSGIWIWIPSGNKFGN